MKTEAKQLDSDSFALLEGKKWKSLEPDDLDIVRWFDELDEELHKYVLVSGENFPPLGREGVEEFITESLVADPDASVNDDTQKLIILFDEEVKNAAILTDELENADSWLDSLSKIQGLSICEGIHKVKSS